MQFKKWSTLDWTVVLKKTLTRKLKSPNGQMNRYFWGLLVKMKVANEIKRLKTYDQHCLPVKVKNISFWM